MIRARRKSAARPFPFSHFKFQFGGQRPRATSGLNGRHFSMHHRPVRRCDAVNSSLSHWRGSVPRLPCVKGAGFSAVYTAEKTEGLTTPPSEIKDFAHLPLHRGGFGAVQN